MKLEISVPVTWLSSEDGGSAVDDHTSIGLNLEYIYSRIAQYRSTGIALGGGVLYQIPSARMTLGASILHLGKQLTSYDGVSEPLPLDITIGVSEHPEHLPVLLSLNFHRLNEDQDTFLKRLNAYTLGAEFTINPTLVLRGGYSNQQKQDLQTSSQSGFTGFSFGAGLLIKATISITRTICTVLSVDARHFNHLHDPLAFYVFSDSPHSKELPQDYIKQFFTQVEQEHTAENKQGGIAAFRRIDFRYQIVC